jgi:hypothetical protein
MGKENVNCTSCAEIINARLVLILKGFGYNEEIKYIISH